MKKLLMIITIIMGVSSAAFSQIKMQKSTSAEAQIIALEKAGWQAWKDKNIDWFKKNTTNDFLQVFGEGTRNKTDVLKATAGECDVKSFSLSDFKFVMLNETAALLSYTAMQDAICGGKTSASKIRASVNYVKRGGKWLEAFYMETPVTE
jgi:hypothetical protein